MTRRRTLLAALLAIAIVASAGITWFALDPLETTTATTADPTTSATSPGQSDAHAPVPTYTPVDPTLAAALIAAPETPVAATFLADPPALSDPAFQTFATGLTDLGDGLYSGDLSAADLSTLAKVAGLKVSRTEPLALDPDPASDGTTDGTVKPAFDDFYSNVRTTVDQVEPGLAAARTVQNIQGTGSVIAIIDTGIDTNAVGLSGKVLERVDMSGSSASCDGGFLDPVGHGTHVASIAAGSVVPGPGGFSGVAPGAKLVDVRIFDCDEHSSTALLSQALNWVLSNRVRLNISVVNLSVSSPGSEQSGTDANSILVNRLVAAGVFVAVAAGNDGDKAATIYSPGTAKYATTVGAAGVGSYGSFLAPYSSQGPIAGRHGVDLLAAGSSIVAARTTAQGTNPSTIAKMGTSMATPFVAGLAALVRQKFPTHKPTGTSCSVSGSCPEGVTGVTNGIENDFSVGDWFAPGEDDITGRGLVSATRTITGVASPASSYLDFTLHADGATVIAVPPHATGVVVDMMTDTSIVADAWSNDSLGYKWFGPTGDTLPSSAPCNTQDGTSGGSVCIIAPVGWGQRGWQFMSPATSDTTYLSLQSTREMHAVLTVPGLTDALGRTDGIHVDDTALDDSGNGSVTVTRTLTSASSTTFDIVTQGGIDGAASIQLPSGPVGTSVAIAVTLEPGYVIPDGESAGRVLLNQAGALAGVVSVGYPGAAALSPRLMIAGEQIHAVDMIGNVKILANGGFFGQSKHPSIVPSPPPAFGHYEWPFLVQPGSNAIVKVPLTQTTNSSIDAFDASGDARWLLLGEYGGGAGLVAGDSDTRYVTFVHDMTNGTNTAIGGPAIDPGQYAAVLSETGSAVAFMRTTGSTTQIYWQGGAGYTDLRLIATFPTSDSPTIDDVSDDVVLIQTFPTDARPLYLYPTDGSDRTILTGHPLNGRAVISADGSAIGIAEGFVDGPAWPYTPVCFNTDTLERVEFPGVDRDVYTRIAVANDCASITADVELERASPRGTLGVKLIRAYPDGTVDTLAQDESTIYNWVMDATGTTFATSTSRPLETADTNGLYDVYRGLYSSKPFLAAPVPTIIGVFRSGSTLTASIPTWSPSATRYTYQWYRNGTTIDLATDADYTAVDSDMGTRLTVTVIGARFDYRSTTVTSAATPVIGGLTFLSKVPVITGTPEVGKPLLVTMAPWGPAPLVIQGRWERDGVTIPGVAGYGASLSGSSAPITFSGYVVSPDDAGAALTFVVTGTKAGYMSLPISSAQLHIKDTFDTTADPVITGIGRYGTTLTATFPGWSPAPTTATYAWKRSGVAISGANKSTYKLTSADAGRVITVTTMAMLTGYSNVTRTSAGIPIERLLTKSTVPLVSGSTAIGGTLTVKSGAAWIPAGVTFAYQWRRNGIGILDATNTTYQLTADDAGATISVAQLGTKSGYTPVTRVSAGLVIRRLFTTAPEPTINGVPRVGTTLTVSRGIWAPATSATYSYRWTREGVTISGATLATYKLVAADAGKSIRVVVTGARTGYFSAARTSAPLAVELLLTKTPIPVIQGAADAGATLTVVSGAWLPDPVELHIQWKRNGIAIDGATDLTYDLTTMDAGFTITAVVTGSRVGYTSVAKSSAALPIRKQLTLHPVPSISGTGTVGSKLTAIPGTWGPAPVVLAYQWLRDDVVIAGAIASTYTPTVADAEEHLTVRVTGSKSGYSTLSQTSAAVEIL